MRKLQLQLLTETRTLLSWKPRKTCNATSLEGVQSKRHADAGKQACGHHRADEVVKHLEPSQGPERGPGRKGRTQAVRRCLQKLVTADDFRLKHHKAGRRAAENLPEGQQGRARQDAGTGGHDPVCGEDGEESRAPRLGRVAGGRGQGGRVQSP